MNLENLVSYVPIILIMGFFILRSLKFRKLKTEIPKLLAHGAVILDVRSSQEYVGGANPVSLNIPLADLQKRVSELDSKKTIIVCCASGTRSGMALKFLKSKGFQSVVNGGPWTNTIVK